MELHGQVRGTVANVVDLLHLHPQKFSSKNDIRSLYYDTGWLLIHNILIGVVTCHVAQLLWAAPLVSEAPSATLLALLAALLQLTQQCCQ